MSLIMDDPEQSPRDCSRKRNSGRNRKRWMLIAAASSTSLILLAIIIYLWLSRPSSSQPHFSLLAATVRVTSVIVVDAAFTASNPNAIYDELRLSASYAGVPLGGSAALELEQQAEVVIMSALLRSTWMEEEEAAAGAAVLRERERERSMLGLEYI